VHLCAPRIYYIPSSPVQTNKPVQSNTALASPRLSAPEFFPTQPIGSGMLRVAREYRGFVTGHRGVAAFLSASTLRRLISRRIWPPRDACPLPRSASAQLRPRGLPPGPHPGKSKRLRPACAKRGACLCVARRQAAGRQAAPRTPPPPDHYYSSSGIKDNRRCKIRRTP